MTDSHKGETKRENVADSWEEAGEEVSITISLAEKVLLQINSGGSSLTTSSLR